MFAMDTDWDLAVFFVPFISLGASLLALILAVAMHLRVRKIFRSANAPDIERLLKLHTKTLEDFFKFQTESTEYLKALDRRIKKKVANSATMRFNPFQGEGIGSNQSFSSVFADEEGDGVILTSMHTRERTNVFAKPLRKWESEHKLSEEEIEAIQNQKQINDAK